MGRTLLYGAMQGWLRAASRAEPDGPRPAATRRRFCRQAVAAGLALGAPGLRGAVARSGPAAGEPRIAVVGAGLAGLVAAHGLAKAGLAAVVYEAAGRVGGRVRSVADAVVPGLVTDLGGEFVDSDHTAVRRLARDLGVDLADCAIADAPHGAGGTYFFGGMHRTEAQIVDALEPISERLLRDRHALPAKVDCRHPGDAAALDRTSMAAYLDGIGAHGWIRDLINVTWATEFGLDPGDQSALNLLLNVEEPEAGKAFPLLEGEHDERYKVRGGSERLASALAGRLGDTVRLGHQLEAVRPAGEGFRLTFARSGGGAIDVAADVVVLCLPFSVLRTLELRVDLPPAQRLAVAQLGYGTNAKFVVGVTRRVWRDQGRSGWVVSDRPFQVASESGDPRGAGATALTAYGGGRRGREIEDGTPAEALARLIGGIDAAFPGLAGALNGKHARSGWIHDPWTRGSYVCYRPGQWTTIAGSEAEPAGALFFAGEHCGGDFRGFMEGAVRSGARAAHAIAQRVRKPS